MAAKGAGESAPKEARNSLNKFANPPALPSLFTRLNPFAPLNTQKFEIEVVFAHFYERVNAIFVSSELRRKMPNNARGILISNHLQKKKRYEIENENESLGKKGNFRYINAFISCELG